MSAIGNTTSDQALQNQFSELLTAYQSRLYGYIFAVVRNWEDTDDLYQSVCLILWRKFESFRPGTNFFSWARQTAYIEICKYLRLKSSPGVVSENLLEELAEPFTNAHAGDAEQYLTALQDCKTKLAPADQQLLDLHYAEDLGTREIADRLQRSQPSVCRSLNRIRHWLLECVRMEMSRREHPRSDVL